MGRYLDLRDLITELNGAGGQANSIVYVVVWTARWHLDGWHKDEWTPIAHSAAHNGQSYPSAEEAKAACQAHYEKSWEYDDDHDQLTWTHGIESGQRPRDWVGRSTANHSYCVTPTLHQVRSPTGGK